MKEPKMETKAKTIVLSEELLTTLKQPVIQVKGPAFARLFAHISTTKCVQQVIPKESCECLDNCMQCWSNHLIE